MQRGGMAFGAHTLTHPDLTRLSLKRAHAEIRDSKSGIEDQLGCAVTAFAYPFGYHNRRIREIAGEHYRCACSSRLATAKRTSDPFALERVEMHYFRTEKLFHVMLAGWFPMYLRLRNIPRQARSFLRRGRWL
jgi:peptidoglycan/xylan/chitin deacetylase (PgdA/CDA1 family)